MMPDVTGWFPRDLNPILRCFVMSYSRLIWSANGWAFTRKTGMTLPLEYWRFQSETRNQVTLRLGVDVIEYFKALAEETGIPYPNLTNLYLRECAQTRKKPALSWAS